MSSNPALTRILCTSLLLPSACGFSELDGLTGGGARSDGGKDGSVKFDAPLPNDAGEDTGIADASLADANPCGCKHGTCTDGACVCPSGFTGATCDTCAPGYFGSNCLACTCQHGTCSDGLMGTGACSCPLGWTGSSCNTTGLALYSKFDEMSGTSAIDSSGNNLNGTYVSISTTAFPTPSTMVPLASMTQWGDKGSLSFQKSTRQAVQVATGVPNFALLQPLNNMTIALWYKAGIADLGVSGSELVSLGDHYVLRLEKDRLDFNKHVVVGGNNTIVYCSYIPASDGGTPAFLNGNWHHIAAISSSVAPGMTIYLDGQLVLRSDQASCINGLFSSTNNIAYTGALFGTDFWVGRQGNGNVNYDFQGNLDELRIYDRVLPPEEIQALAQGNHLPP